jgi:hypothetical protein
MHLAHFRDANVAQRQKRLAELGNGDLRQAGQGKASGQQNG